MQCYKLLGQHCTGFLSMQCLRQLKTIKTTLNKIFSYALLSGASRTAPHKVFLVQTWPSRYSWDDIAQIKTLCSVVREAPNNTTQEKILFNIVFISLGQRYSGKNPMQCCPWGSRQQCNGKHSVQYCLNTLGTTWHKWKRYSMLSERRDNIAQEKTWAMLS